MPAAPYGLALSSGDARIRDYYIPQTDTSTYAVGDVVSFLAGATNGMLPNGQVSVGMPFAQKWVAGTSPCGVVVGIKAPFPGDSFSRIPATKRTAWVISVCDDPDAVFSVQANNAGTLPQSVVGAQGLLVVGAPSGSVSSTYLSSTLTGTSVTVLSADSLAPYATVYVRLLNHALASSSISAANAAALLALLSGAGATEVANWAALPDPTTVTAGRAYTVLAAVVTGGALGTRWYSDGTLWRPAGRQVLLSSLTQVDGAVGGSTSEQILFSVQFPANSLLGAREITVRANFVFSAVDTNTKTGRIRMGAAGSTADAIINLVNGASGNRTFLLGGSTTVTSATTVRAWGANFTGSAVMWNADTSAGFANAQTDATVSALSSATYISATIQQGVSPTSTASRNMIEISVE